MKVLLVDDSRTIRKIQRNVLARLGHTDVLEASDGLEALKLLEKARPDLVLIDWNLPNMDGLALVRRIRSTDKSLPLIMCTTESDRARVLEALKAGVNNYVVKPFSTETLAEKITQTMERAARRAETADASR